MKLKIALLVIVLLLLGGGGWAYHHFRGNKPVASPGSTTGPTTQPVSTQSVKIHNYTYSPTDITVKAGTTVTWTNQDLPGVTIVEDDDKTGGPSSSVLTQTQTYSFKFAKTGLFHYHNSLDPQMTGTVTVTAAN